MGNLSHNIDLNNMDRRIIIQSVSEAVSSSGAMTETWSTFATVWAQVGNASRIGSSGRKEAFVSDRETAYNRQSFFIRYRTDIDEKMRIQFKSKDYDILSIAEVPGTRLRFLQIEAELRE